MEKVIIADDIRGVPFHRAARTADRCAALSVSPRLWLNGLVPDSLSGA